MAIQRVVGGLLSDLAQDFGSSRSARIPTRAFEMGEQAMVPPKLQDPEVVVGIQGMINASDDPLEAMSDIRMKEANAMLRRGETNEDIIAKTGFYFDENNRIKKAIDDVDAELVLDVNNLKPNKKYTLSDVLQHPSLYSYYPHFKDMKVEFYKGPPNNPGEYDPNTNTIKLNKNSPRFIEAGDNQDRKLELIETLLHETQHAIQKFEKFMLGGDMNKFLRDPNNATEKEREEAFKKYLSIGGELEARTVEQMFRNNTAAKLMKKANDNRNFLQLMGTDPLSKKYNVNPKAQLTPQGNPLQIEEPFYQDPFERTA